MEPKVVNRIIEITSMLAFIRWALSRGSNETASEKVLCASSWLHMCIEDLEDVTDLDKPVFGIDVKATLEQYSKELGDICVDPVLRPFTEQAMINLREALFLLRK